MLLGDQITIAKLLWDETKKQLTKQITEKRIQNKKITEKKNVNGSIQRLVY